MSLPKRDAAASSSGTLRQLVFLNPLTRLFLVAATALLVSCGGGSGTAAPATSASAVIGAAGGTLTGPDGVQVIIPAGALDADTTIGIARSPQGAPPAPDAFPPAAGYTYELTPHGLTFNSLVTVRAPVPGGAAAPAVFMASVGEDWKLMDAQVVNGMLEWQRNSFSNLLIGTGCFVPTAMANDPYWCRHSISYARVTATPSSALFQTSPGHPTNGDAGSYRVDQAATLQFKTNFSIPGNCSNVAVKLRRFAYEGSAARTWGPPIDLQTKIPALTVDGGVYRGVETFDLPFAHPLAGRNLFSVVIHYDCPTVTRSSGAVTGWNHSVLRSQYVGDGMIVVGNVPAPTVFYTVGGSVSGLTGSGLALQNNGADNLAIAANGAISFATQVGEGTPYAVTVLTQPVGQTCTVANGSGTANATVTNVAVSCVAAPVNSIIPRFAYVANSGSNDVSAYTINASTGGLTSVGAPVAAGTNPYSVTVDPLGKFAFVANHISNNVSAYTINASTGGLTSVGAPVAAGTNPYSITVDPSGKFAYVANFGSANVSTYSIHATTGTLTGVSSTASGAQPLFVAIDPTGKFAYVAANGGVLRTYTINATTGALTMVSDVVPGFSLRSVTVDPSGKFAFAAVAHVGVMAYTINPATGSLTAVAGNPVTAGTFPISVAVDPTGKFAYVANFDSNNVSIFTIHATTGSLSPVGNVAAGTQPHFVTVDPSGKFAYVANFGSGNVSVYSINASTGALTSVGAAVASGLNPTSVTTTSQ